MTKNSRFRPGQSGNPKTQFQPGNPHRWQPGQSGNPAGISRSRSQFEECFYGALLDQGSPDEAAALLWESARKREPWAIQAILQRLAPDVKQTKPTPGEKDASPIDYTRLNDNELDQLEQLLQRATVPTGPGEGGEGKTQL